MSAPTAPDLVTLRLPRDVAREYLRALEALATHAEELSLFAPREINRETTAIVRKTESLHEALHAALYREVTP